MLTNISVKGKSGIYNTGDKDRDDDGRTLPLSLTKIVEPSIKLTPYKEDDHIRRNILFFYHMIVRT